jgi:methionine-rich copper-binding protein CopC
MMTGALAQRLSLVAAGALVVGMSVLGFAAPAQAHNYLVSSTPKAGATLTALPDQFTITTNGPLLDLAGDGAGFALEVVDAYGNYYGDGCVTVSGSTISTHAALGAAGKYRIVWQAVSNDGHTVSSTIPFSWAPTPGVTVSQGSSIAPDCYGSRPVASGATPPPIAPAPTANANLGDVLWIGGTIAAVLIAIATTLILTSRKKSR